MVDFRSTEMSFLGFESLLIACFFCRNGLVFSCDRFLLCIFCFDSNPDFLRKLELGGSSASESSGSSELEN